MNTSWTPLIKAALPSIAATVLLALGAPAQASLITLSTGFSAAGPLGSAAAYKSTVEAAVASPTTGYGSTTLSSFDSISNHGLFGSNSNVAFDFTVSFNVNAVDAGLWEFRAGVDFGRGGAMFLDGVALGFKSNDMWWNGSYSNPSQYFDYSAVLGAGNHVLSIYGLEGCCDGNQQAQFRNTGAFTTFSATDGNNPIPEPATLGLLGLGLLGLAGSRRKA